MFLDNKYAKWYYQIIKNASTRETLGYTETHHIIPKSLGGSNKSENLIVLTAREHFVCHLLLSKMVTDEYKYKMSKAITMMNTVSGRKQQRYKVSSHIYKILKERVEVPQNVRDRMSESQRLRFNNSPGTFSGKQHSEETRRKMSKAASRPKSTTWKESASEKRKGKVAPNKGIPHSTETKLKISQAVSGEKNGFYGKRHSLEQREKKRQEKLNVSRLECPYCSKIVDPMNFARWHGNKCKQK